MRSGVIYIFRPFIKEIRGWMLSQWWACSLVSRPFTKYYAETISRNHVLVNYLPHDLPQTVVYNGSDEVVRSAAQNTGRC